MTLLLSSPMGLQEVNPTAADLCTKLKQETINLKTKALKNIGTSPSSVTYGLHRERGSS